uniref:T-complex protein 11-like protein 1 n=1 Tax=Noccaea caerulescens TaxID=107243 RepID=A0A1J3FDR1_NOCCA
MEKDRGEAIALEIATEIPPAVTRVPRRIRERLLPDFSKKTVPSVQDIEDKLLHAHLRRQQFYHNVSRKARAKPKSPSRSSDEELGQRIEARLLAAEQKRLEILAKAQMRLAKLDELRQAAKTSVEIRSERERVKLGSQVESRVQKAEANRMRILKASHQKRASAKERTSQSMMRRMARESKYKERVRASINQKRVAAEKKRLGLLEAEKKKARARVQQVRHVANSVSNQREMERSKMRDKLEDKLQRAKRHRSEFLRQRRRQQRDSFSLYCDMMQEDAVILSRKLSRCWRCFVRQKRTTLALAKDYDGLKISESLPFEQLAVLLESPATLKAVKSLLDRLEVRLEASKNVTAVSQPSILDNIDHLLKRVATPRRKVMPTTLRSRKGKKVSPGTTSVKMSRYPVRVFLSAFMILGHPDAVFNGQGDQEAALNNSAKGFLSEFKLLVKVIQEGPVKFAGGESKLRTLRSQLEVFDKAWCSFLNSFVIWKVKDARLLEDDLVRAACQLELSMIQKCNITPQGDTTMLTHDKKAIQMQVTQDQELLTEKVRHLSGVAGVVRMESALSETRSKYFQAKENGSPMAHQLACFFSPSAASSPVQSVSSSSSRSKESIGVEGSKRVIRSLFKDDTPPPSSGPSRVSNDTVDEVAKENEFIVNELLHDWNFKFPGGSSVKVKDEEDNLKRKIKETMEKAFWDSVMESMKLEEPDYSCISNLMREVRDELCQMAPDSWKAEITETVDLELLSQLLNSGTLDIDYLGKMLEFALATLRKLSAPANDRENESTHQNLLEELHRLCQAKDESGDLRSVAIVKGIRFILEQIQELKREIGIGRITIMKPLLQGPAGFDYLTQAFEKRYGPPSQACDSLPVTRRWISALSSCKDEWEEHTNTLSALNVVERPSMGISLKTGGSFLSTVNTASQSTVTDTAEGQVSECKGERVDLTVRLGLLKLVSQVSGLTPEVLPETFELNLSRLRNIQAEIQKIMVVSTSLLIWRQMIPGKSESETESMAKKLLDLLDRKEEAGLMEIVETTMSEEGEEKKKMMRGLLGKSLGEGNTVYERVTDCIYKAVRGVLLAGNGENGKRLVEREMKKVGGGGSCGLKEKVLETARALGLVACVSVRGHGPWLTRLISEH